MVSTLQGSHNWKRINVPLASFAGGLALGTVAIIGGGELLGDNGDTASAPSRAQAESRSLGPVMDEPDFGSVAIESAPAIVDPHFGTGADSVSAIEGDNIGVDQLEFAVVDPHFGTGLESVSAIEGDYLQ